MRAAAAWDDRRRALGHTADEPFFTTGIGKCLDRAKFSQLLRNSLQAGGYDASAYGTHSCRAGGAVTLLSVPNINVGAVKSYGRWSSDAYMAYIRYLPDDLRADMQKAMATVGHSQITAAHHAIYQQRYE